MTWYDLCFVFIRWNVMLSTVLGNYSQKVVIQMSAEHEDLMVLEEGGNPEALQACCTTGTAAVR